jgi:hypothetical protein
VPRAPENNASKQVRLCPLRLDCATSGARNCRAKQSARACGKVFWKERRQTSLPHQVALRLLGKPPMPPLCEVRPCRELATQQRSRTQKCLGLDHASSRRRRRFMRKDPRRESRRGHTWGFDLLTNKTESLHGNKYILVMRRPCGSPPPCSSRPALRKLRSLRSRGYVPDRLVHCPPPLLLHHSLQRPRPVPQQT